VRPSRLVAALSATLLAGGLASCSDDAPDGADHTSAASPTSSVSGSGDSSPSEEPSEEAVPAGVKVTELDSGPVGLAVVGDGVWSALPDAGAVRTADGQLVKVGTNPLRLVSTPSGVWVSVITDGKLVRIDPRTAQVDLRVRMVPRDSEPEGLAFHDGAVWVVDQANWELIPYEASSGLLAQSSPTGPGPRLVTAGATALWVGDYVGKSITRAGDGTTVTKSLDGCSPQGLAEVEGLVWVACTFEDTVLGVDVRTMKVAVRLEGIDSPDAVTTDGTTVYVVGQRGPTVFPIDASTHQLGDPFALDDQLPVNENVDAVVLGTDLVVSHPDARRLYTVPLALLQ
jgi:streptogramin lyase